MVRVSHGLVIFPPTSNVNALHLQHPNSVARVPQSSNLQRLRVLSETRATFVGYVLLSRKLHVEGFDRKAQRWTSWHSQTTLRFPKRIERLSAHFRHSLLRLDRQCGRARLPDAFLTYGID